MCRNTKMLSITLTPNGKRQTVDSCVTQKRENLRFSTCLTLLGRYSNYKFTEDIEVFVSFASSAELKYGA